MLLRQLCTRICYSVSSPVHTKHNKHMEQVTTLDTLHDPYDEYEYAKFELSAFIKRLWWHVVYEWIFNLPPQSETRKIMECRCRAYNTKLDSNEKIFIEFLLPTLEELRECGSPPGEDFRPLPEIDKWTVQEISEQYFHLVAEVQRSRAAIQGFSNEKEKAARKRKRSQERKEELEEWSWL